MIIKDIIDELSFELKRRKVINLCVSPYYTASIVESIIGVANTVPEGQHALSGKISGRSSLEVTSDTSSPLARSIVLSVLNSIDLGSWTSGDITETLEGSKLCVFGYSPSIKDWRFERIIVYDFNDNLGQSDRYVVKPYSEFKEEYCDVAYVYSSSIINGTIDNILAKVDAEKFVLMGVSTPDAPLSLKKAGIDYLVRPKFRENLDTFKSICEGSPPSVVKGFIEGNVTKNL